MVQGTTLTSESHDDPWRTLDGVADRIAGLSGQGLSEADFYAKTLELILAGLDAAGGAIRTIDANGKVRLACQVRSDAVAEPFDDHQRREELLGQVLQAGVSIAGPPRVAGGSADQANATDFVWLLSPWRCDNRLAGVLEVYRRQAVELSAQGTDGGLEASLRFLEAMGELIADFHRGVENGLLRRQISEMAQFAQFSGRVHASLDLDATAYTIANEARRLLASDRVSVLVRERSRYRLVAVSGVDTIQRRATSVRSLERLSEGVAAAGDSLWYLGRAEDLAAPIERALGAYLDESHASTLVVAPLKIVADGDESNASSETVGVLVVERFYAGSDDLLRRGFRAIEAPSAAALHNAVELRHVPLAGVLIRVGRFWRRHGQRRALIFSGVAACIAAVLIFVPADFRIEAHGKLQPLVTREVFASNDGIVEELDASHGREVRVDEKLAILKKPELDMELKRIGGELETAANKLRTVEAERLRDPTASEDERRRHNELTAQEEELRGQVANLTEQYAVSKAESAQLTLRSPIAGTVLTWDVEPLLKARPVSRGQSLLTVADLAGPWGLELRVPENRIAHLLEAAERIKLDLDVSFVLASEPGVKLHGKIARLGMRTEVAEAESPFMVVHVNVDRNELPQRVPGTTVVAKIDCGRRSLGYVWLHELIETIRYWTWI